MKVLVIGNGIPSDKSIAGIFEFDQAIALKRNGVDVEYLCVDLRSIRRVRPFGYSCGVKDGVSWSRFSFPLGRCPSTLYSRIGFFFIWRLYKRLLQKGIGCIDIIHAHFTENAAIGAYLAKKTNIPLVVTEHNSAINVPKLNHSIEKTACFAYNTSQVVIAVSNALAINIRLHFGIESVIIPNIVDSRFFSIRKKENKDGLRLVTVSNLIELKRTINIIKALNKVLTYHPDVYLDVVGDGILKNELQQYVIDNGMSENVTFYGLLSRDEIIKLYERVDCFVMVSSTETFGVVYIEAMAAGLPVIATKCGGPEGFLNEKVGMLIDVDDIDQLQMAITYMYSHRGDYDDEYIRQYAKEHFYQDVVAAQIISEYNKIKILTQ